jgi:predicted nucleic acid-binding protein
MLLDTSAWIELFADGTASGKVQRILLEYECQTALTTIAEISGFAARTGRNPYPIIKMIVKHSRVVPPTEEIAVLAGKLNVERKRKSRKWGIMQSFVLATGLVYGFKIVAKGADFKDLDGVEMI